MHPVPWERTHVTFHVIFLEWVWWVGSFYEQGIKMMLILSVLVCVSSCLCVYVSSHYVGLAFGARFACCIWLMYTQISWQRGRERAREMVCDCMWCMCSEANWSRVSSIHIRLMAWLQPCDWKFVYLSVCNCACVGILCNSALACQVCVFMWVSVIMTWTSSRTRQQAIIIWLSFFLLCHLFTVHKRHICTHSEKEASQTVIAIKVDAFLSDGNSNLWLLNSVN